VIAACDGVLGRVGEIGAQVDEVASGCAHVRAVTTSLEETCDRLVSERNQLEAFHAELGSRLRHFDSLDGLAVALAPASAQALDPGDVLGAVADLGAAQRFLRGSPHYRDAAQYASLGRQLEARALALVRSRVQAALQAAAAAAREEEAGAARRAGAPAGAARGAVALARFRAAAEPPLRELLVGLEALDDPSDGVRGALRSARADLCAVRWEALRAGVEAAVAELQGAAVERGRAGEGAPGRPDLVGFLVEALELLAGVARSELSLLAVFFPRAAAADPAGALEGLLPGLERPVYDRVRGAIVGVASVDELCGMVDVLGEWGGDAAGGAAGGGAAGGVAPGAGAGAGHGGGGGGGGGGAALRPLAARLLADARERLTFRCQSMLRDRVHGYRPADADLDPAAALAALPPPPPGAPAPPGDPWARVEPALCPPVRATMAALSGIHGRLAPGVFGGLAEEATSACLGALSALQAAAAPRAGPLDAALAGLMNVLALRARLASFQADLTVSEVELDFSGMRSRLQRLLFSGAGAAGGGKGGGGGGPGGAWEFLASGQGGFEVGQRRRDPRSELEARVQAACEDVIRAAMQLSADPLLRFLTRVTAAQVAAGGGGGARAAVRDLDFGRPEAVAALVASVNEGLRERLPAVAARLRLFLPDGASRRAVARPVRGNVSEALAQLTAVLVREYDAEEVAGFGLVPAEELRALVDDLA